MNIPHIYADAGGAAAGCAEYILALLRSAVDERGKAFLAVSGGRSPKLMFTRLREVGFDWNKIQFFFVDERCVPPESDQSNYRLANDELLALVNFPRENIHQIDGEVDPEPAAALYVGAIQEAFGLSGGELPIFDVIHHGMGPDGHTASLFPGEPWIADRTGIAAAVHVAKLNSDRVTLLPGVLLAARSTVFLVDGEDKRAALQEVLSGTSDAEKYPSQLLSRSGKRVDWFVGGLPGIQF